MVPFGCSSPDRCVGHLSRIADLEDQLSSLKQQTRAAMDQAAKSSSLSKKSIFSGGADVHLVAKIAQLKE
jgi:hypothetical protein